MSLKPRHLCNIAFSHQHKFRTLIIKKIFNISFHSSINCCFYYCLYFSFFNISIHFHFHSVTQFICNFSKDFFFFFLQTDFEDNKITKIATHISNLLHIERSYIVPQSESPSPPKSSRIRKESGRIWISRNKSEK